MSESENKNASRERFKLERPLLYNKFQNLKDKFLRGESIGIVRIEYDYNCNMTCEHCCIKGFQGGQVKRKMTIADVKELSRQADELGLARFVITGGEPLLFPDLEELVQAIDPKKFYINMDTNAWLLDLDKAKWLKKIGIDRVQISLDNFYPELHDKFRNKPGSHARVLSALDFVKEAGLDINITTVVDKIRLHSEELTKFLEFTTANNVPVCCQWAKPIGKYEGNKNCLIDKEDIAFEKELEKKYKVFNHLTPAYGLDMGCIAVKGIFSITAYGDVLPCPYMHIALGNIFEEPLKVILEKGMNIKAFHDHVDTCLIAEDKDFIANYEKKLYGKKPPVYYKEVFEEEK